MSNATYHASRTRYERDFIGIEHGATTVSLMSFVGGQCVAEFALTPYEAEDLAERLHDGATAIRKDGDATACDRNPTTPTTGD